MTVNETLKNRRIELGLSQKKVGEDIKVAQSTLCRFEQGCKMQNKDLITHKLINYYKDNKFEVEPKQKANVKIRNNKENNKKDSFEIMGEEIEKKFGIIFKQELEKEAKRVYKKTLRQLIREL